MIMKLCTYRSECELNATYGIVSGMEWNRIGVLGGIPQLCTNSTLGRFKLVQCKSPLQIDLNFIGMLGCNYQYVETMDFWNQELFRNLICNQA